MATPTTDVKGIGPAAAKLLAEQGIASAEDLAATTLEKLVAIPGFSDIRARQVIAAANLTLNPQSADAGEAGDKAKPEKSKKDKKKKDKNKDGKGKKKDAKKDQKKAAKKEKKAEKKKKKKKK